jgi:hypothetical protein
MDAGSFRFGVGEFECLSASDGALNYPPESLFSNVPLERVEEALRERNLPTAQVMTPYSCLFVDTGEHRVLVDAGAGDLGAHAALMFPGLRSFNLGYGSVTREPEGCRNRAFRDRHGHYHPRSP